MSEFGEGPSQEKPKQESKQISRRTFLKGLGGAAAVALGFKGTQEVSKRIDTDSTPISSAEARESIEDHPPVSEIFLGNVTLYLGELQDEKTLQKNKLNIRKRPTTTDRLIDNRRVVGETIPTDKIKSINGVDLQGSEWVDITNPVLVKGEDVERANGDGDRWLRINLVVDDTFGRDDKVVAYVNFSPQTEGFVTGEPNPEAPNGGGFISAQEVGDSIQILEQGAYWKPAPVEVNVATIPNRPQQ